MFSSGLSSRQSESGSLKWTQSASGAGNARSVPITCFRKNVVPSSIVSLTSFNVNPISHFRPPPSCAPQSTTRLNRPASSEPSQAPNHRRRNAAPSPHQPCRLPPPPAPGDLSPVLEQASKDAAAGARRARRAQSGPGARRWGPAARGRGAVHCNPCAAEPRGAGLCAGRGRRVGSSSSGTAARPRRPASGRAARHQPRQRARRARRLGRQRLQPRAGRAPRRARRGRAGTFASLGSSQGVESNDISSKS